MEDFNSDDLIIRSGNESVELRAEQQNNSIIAVSKYKKYSKIVIMIGIIMIITVSFFAFTTTVPDIVGVDEETAKNIIEKAGLIPAIQHRYEPKNDDIDKTMDDYVEEGKVYEVNPSYPTRVKSGSKVNISVSKGPQIIEPKARINYFKNHGLDELEFVMATVNGDELRIMLMPTIKNCKKFKWDAFCYASINESFDNELTAVVEVRDLDFKEVESGECVIGQKHYVSISVPLNSFEKRTLEELYLNLPVEVNGTKQTMKFSFDFSW